MILKDIEKENAQIVEGNKQIVERMNQIISANQQLQQEYNRLSKQLDVNMGAIAQNNKWIESLKKKEEELEQVSDKKSKK